MSKSETERGALVTEDLLGNALLRRQSKKACQRLLFVTRGRYLRTPLSSVALSNTPSLIGSCPIPAFQKRLISDQRSRNAKGLVKK